MSTPLVELVPAAAASLVTLAFKPEEGRFATWMAAEGIRRPLTGLLLAIFLQSYGIRWASMDRLTIQLCASCTASAYNGATATHLPIFMFVLDR
jgi:hypothetical protein